MKKHLAYTMASLVALSAISAPAVSVYAQTETSTVETANETGTIQTAEEFLNLYCSYKNEIKDAQGNVVRTEYLRFTEIDEKNYQIVLEGTEVYEGLKEELKEEINTALSEVIIDQDTQATLNKTYPELVVEAQQIKDEQSKDQTQEEPSIPEQEPTDPATEMPDSNHGAIKEEGSLEETQEESKEESDPVSEMDSKDTKEPVEVQSSDNAAIETPLQRTQQIETISEPVLLKVATPQQESVSIEEKAEMISTAEPEIQPVQAKIETTAQPVQTTSSNRTLSSTDSEVQTFVKTYLMDANSTLYTSVSSYNYQQILSGMSAYSKLSTDQVAQLNSYLETNGSSKYITLVSQAQRIDNTSTTPVRRSVNTATSSGFGLYGALMTLSFVGFAGLWKKMKEKKA
ncbi:hypothetical protein [Faecalicoccus acidiformans]|uniref:Uncharacterized protein n=1 Tax=Faecalicoccus acidiformans TaxID=915173 RepID=A0ABS2FNI4_9FIRM|nr:hypothetical protein [Faecalicoccus acidiformans]MBM6831150.1 hypothetical protein [Faecalicoccus acidiformans]